MLDFWGGASAPVQGLAPNPNQEEISEYFLSAGYPKEIVEMLDDDTRKEFFNGKYQYQSSDISFGIRTDEYNIAFTFDKNKNVLIDKPNLDELKQLLADEEAIEKILEDIIINNTYLGRNIIQLAIKKSTNKSLQNVETDISTARQNILSNIYRLKKDLNKENVTIITATLANFYSSLVCSKISQNNNYLQKKLTYTWFWSYKPWVTDVDKVAMAWSGDFNAQPSTIHWSYSAWGDEWLQAGGAADMIPTGNRDSYTWSGYGYNEYDPSCGVGKNIDIKREFRFSDRPHYVYLTYLHQGSFSTTLTRYYYGVQDQASAVGRYYHRTVVLTGGTFSFSKSGPSISLSWGWAFDLVDSIGAVFNFYQ